MEPDIRSIKNGWAAVGNGWAVFAQSRTEAIEKYREAEQTHAELAAREPDPVNARYDEIHA